MVQVGRHEGALKRSTVGLQEVGRALGPAGQLHIAHQLPILALAQRQVVQIHQKAAQQRQVRITTFRRVVILLLTCRPIDSQDGRCCMRLLRQGLSTQQWHQQCSVHPDGREEDTWRPTRRTQG